MTGIILYGFHETAGGVRRQQRIAIEDVTEATGQLFFYAYRENAGGVRKEVRIPIANFDGASSSSTFIYGYTEDAEGVRYPVRVNVADVVDEGAGGGTSAVRFGQDAVFTSAGLVTSNSPLGLFSFFVDVDDLLPVVFYGPDGNVWSVSLLKADSDDGPSFYAKGLFSDVTNSVAFQFSGYVPIGAVSGWVNILLAVDTNHPAGEKIGIVVIDRAVAELSDVTDDADAFDIGWTLCPTSTTVGSNSGFGGTPGSLALPYAALGQFLDISNPLNVAKFVDGQGKPVSLGSDGSLPTGTAPTIFFDGNASAFGQLNLGTGGGFALTGSLTDAATSPSD